MDPLTAPAAPTNPQFYTVKEVAEILRVSVHTVYRAIEDEELPALRFRGRVIVSAKAVQRLIALGNTELDAVAATGAPTLRAGVA